MITVGSVMKEISTAEKQLITVIERDGTRNLYFNPGVSVVGTGMIPVDAGSGIVPERHGDFFREVQKIIPAI